MSYNPNNPNGQATSANSAPVVIASNQSKVSVGQSDNLVTGTITAADTGSTSATGYAGQSVITGTPTAGSFVLLQTTGISSVAFALGGNLNGTLVFERSLDGVQWAPFNCFPTGTPQVTNSVVSTGSTTGQGDFHGLAAGHPYIRVRATVYNAGTANVTIDGSFAPGTVSVNSPIRLYDQTNNTQGVIKPASTAVAATDTAMSVGLHPTSPLPAGTNTIGSLTANQSVNNTQIVGNAVLTGAGATGAGSQRVTIAADSGTVAGSTSLPAGTNTIGAVSNTTFAVTQATGTNLHTVVDSGAVTVSQATAANLNATVAGSVTANAGTNLNTSALALDATLTGNNQRSRITDGTNIANVKAASTAAVAADPALVVAVSPNNTVPVSLASNTPTLQSGSTTAVTQVTAANLNATVVGTGTLSVQNTAATPAGTNSIGTVQPGNTANTTPWLMRLAANAAGGYTPGKLISAASTNATSVKTSAATVGYITASNVNASPRFLKIYNLAAAPTVGTSVPVHTFLIPGNTAGAGTNIPLPPQGIALGTGFSFAITAAAADSDATAVAAAEVILNYGFI